jgi:site-specific recombinase XerD
MMPLTSANSWIRYLAENGSTGSRYTLRTYAYHLFDFLSFLEFKKCRWEEIDNSILTNYRDAQDLNRSPHTKDYISRKTINARLLVVGQFYKFAHENSHIEKNPIIYKTIKYRLPLDVDMKAHTGRTIIREVPLATFERLGRVPIKWQPHETVMKWINTIDRWQDKLIAKLLYRTGMRRSEVLDLQTYQLPERTGKTLSQNEISFNITGKGKKERLIYISIRDFNELHDFIRLYRAKLIKKGNAHDYIFVNKNGSRLSPNYVNNFFSCISKKSGIHLTPHMMRHSFAVFALQYWRSLGLSQPEKLLQARLGHSSVVTTQIYMHLTDERKAEEARGNALLIDLMMQGELLETTF